MSLLRSNDIRSKLAFALWGTALAGLVVAGSGVALFQSLTLEQRALQIMEPYAQLVSVGTDSAVAFQDPVRAQEVLDTLRANPQILEAQIYLDDGELLANFNRGARTRRLASLPLSDGIHIGDDKAALLQGLPRGGRLHISMGVEQLNAQTHQIMVTFGMCVLALLIITLVTLTVLRRTIVRPIASLTEAAELVRTRGDYHHRIPLSDTDELARLGKSFNAMMAAIEEREAELRRLTDFQRTILENAAYGIVSTSPDGTVTSFNPAAERLLGYAANEIVGKQTPALWHDLEEIARHAAQLSEELHEPISPGFDVFTTRPRRNLPEEGEWTFVRKDGLRIPVNLSVTALRDERGRIAGFVGLTYDLTARKRAEAEIGKLNQELEQRVAERTAQLEAANKELEAFSYSVSHDLRSPLRHIDGFLSLLKRNTAATLDEKGRHYMDTISDAAKRMGTLIDDLLAFSHMGRHEMAAANVDLGALVQESIRELEPETKGRSIDWRIGTLPVVTGDRAMLRVVLMNLLSNAVKFTQRRAQAEIEVGCLSNQESETVVFVRDNGAGFNMKYADKLFGVFQRLHGVDEFEGTGIGLANVHRIISRHRGKTWAEGKVDAGATFFFSLPRARSTK